MDFALTREQQAVRELARDFGRRHVAPVIARFDEAQEFPHEIVAEQDGRAAARVHAFIHRKQGDIVNADYWYYRAGAKRPRGGLGKEWRTLVQQFLNRS